MRPDQLPAIGRSSSSTDRPCRYCTGSQAGGKVGAADPGEDPQIQDRTVGRRAGDEAGMAEGGSRRAEREEKRQQEAKAGAARAHFFWISFSAGAGFSSFGPVVSIQRSTPCSHSCTTEMWSVPPGWRSVVRKPVNTNSS